MQVGVERVGEGAEKSSATERGFSGWQRRLQLSSSQRRRRRRQRRVHCQPSARYSKLFLPVSSA